MNRFIRRHCRSQHEVADIRQDVYERVIVGASRVLPMRAGPYVFTVARNVLINRVRRSKIISMEFVADLEGMTPDVDWLTPIRHAEGREELRMMQAGLEQLPPRCREVIRLRKVEGLSTREVAGRLGVTTDAVEQQITLGMRALVDFMLGGDGRIRRPDRASHQRKKGSVA